MQPELHYARIVFQNQHERFTRAVDGLPDAGLNWRPGQDMNAIGQLVRHVVAYQRVFFSFALGEPAVRSEAEIEEMHVHSFRDEPATNAEVTALLTEEYARVEAELARLDAMDLSDGVTTLRGTQRERRRFITQAMLHAQEHMGHAEITRQLWDQRHGT
jgi:uncharacterized damage-inducible protein DinB